MTDLNNKIFLTLINEKTETYTTQKCVNMFDCYNKIKFFLIETNPKDIAIADFIINEINNTVKPVYTVEFKDSVITIHIYTPDTIDIH